MIHVCFGLHDKTGRYSKFTGTAMLSIFANTNSKITVHILHDNTLSIENRDKFIYLAGQYGQFVKFYNVEKLCADRIEKIYQSFPRIDKRRFSIATFYRFFIPVVFPNDIEKAIYLDSDIIVNIDINEFWKIELGDKVLGVVPENTLGAKSQNQPLCLAGYVKGEDYFNAGVLLMNLTLLREKEATIIGGIKFLSENPQYEKYLDQDVLNYCFSTESLTLPVKFNMMMHLPVVKKKENIDKEIYHFSAHSLRLNMNNPFFRLYINYFMKTPWFDENTIGRLYEGFLNIRNNLKRQTAKLSATLSDKTRAFFVEPTKIESMKKFFAIRDDEIIIPAENEESIQKLIDAMKVSQGKCVFFIMTKKFLGKKFPIDLLTEAGFALNKDFVKGWEILSEAYGGPFNSYPLIQAM